MQSMIKTTDPSDVTAMLKRDRMKRKADRIIAINAGIYVKRKYTRPRIETSQDGVKYVKLKLRSEEKVEYKVDQILVTRSACPSVYSIELAKDDEVTNVIYIPVDQVKLYEKALSAIKRSGL